MLSNKEKNHFLSEGFTLVELMIVIVITVALTILVLSGYSEGRPRLSVERTTESFIMDLYRARNKGFFATTQSMVAPADGKYGILVTQDREDYDLFFAKGGTINTIETIKMDGLSKTYAINTPLGLTNSVRISFSSDSSGKKVHYNDILLLANQHILITFSAKNNDEIKRSVRIYSSGVAEVVY